jgi:O-succinylbenzoate synthase
VDRPLKIANINIFEYDLPFHKPFFIHKTSLTSRAGLLIYVVTDDGTTGVGEIAPLEGMSVDPLKKALHQAKTVRPKLLGCPVPVGLSEIREFLSFPLFGGWVPAVRSGFEAALVHLSSVLKNQSPSQILGGPEAADVKTAALLQGTPEEVKAEAAHLYVDGYRTFKLKVGSKNIPLDVKKVEGVREVIGDSKLRLDANGAWRLNEAVPFGELIGTDKIQMIEDPIVEFDQLDEFYQKTKLPIAVDETLGQADPAPIHFCEGVRYFVVKPMMVGGIFRTLEWIAKAKAEGRQVIVSSSFESSIGLSMLANLALLTDEAAGLGTAAWFADDLLKSPVIAKSGSIPKNLLRFQLPDIKIERLKLID